MRRILGQKFFERPAPQVAKSLLGKYLVRKISGKEIALEINEVEAYHGPRDLASHASRGLTSRTKVMFGAPGRLYIYLIYGMYEMLNVVTGRSGFPSAVLVRAAGTYNGPGKLTKALRVNRCLNGRKLSWKSGLWVEDRGKRANPSKVIQAKRVGVEYAGPLWSKKPWRFMFKANKKTNKGFTFLSLLISLAIIGILISVMFSSIIKSSTLPNDSSDPSEESVSGRNIFTPIEDAKKARELLENRSFSLPE